MGLKLHQQKLVTENLKLAERLADATGRGGCTLEERRSAAYLGLCQAARAWKGHGRAYFRKFASFKIVSAISAAHQDHDREFDEQAIGGDVVDRLEAPDPFRAFERQDELLGLLGRFTGQDRAWLDAYLDTGNWRAAARKLGVGNEEAAEARLRLRLASLNTDN
jgi:hypothetical protein